MVMHCILILIMIVFISCIARLGSPLSKSSSLAPVTRKRLVAAVCQSVSALSSILGSSGSSAADKEEQSSTTAVVSQAFRDALSCHLYMLFSIMHFTESECKSNKMLNVGSSNTTAGTTGGKKKKLTAKEQERKSEAEALAASRDQCARSMLSAATAMSTHANRLWRRGVPDEDVVNLPCRIAYQILEAATGVQARKACCGTEALGMIAATVDSAPTGNGSSILNTIVAALVDLLHSYEHVAALVAELCTMVDEVPTNRLAVELMREIGRMDMSGPANGGGDAAVSAAAAAAGGKASGVRNVAPFLPELASRRPRLVLSQISLILPHLDCEPYQLRSAIVAAVGNILTQVGQADGSEEEQQPQQDGDMDGTSSEDGSEGAAGAEAPHHMSNLGRGRSALLDILTERVRDSSSFTRVAVLKAWATVVEADCLPLERFLPVTALAIGRLQDKTVMVRRSAMQVSFDLSLLGLVGIYVCFFGISFAFTPRAALLSQPLFFSSPFAPFGSF